MKAKPENKGKRPRGRQLTFSPDLALKICERLGNGESLRAICREEGMPAHSTVLLWVIENHSGFADQYARARDFGLQILEDDLLEISDDGRNDWMMDKDPDNPGYILNGEHVQRSRLRVDTRKWMLSKLAPKKYGDRTKIEHSGNIGLEALVHDDETE